LIYQGYVYLGGKACGNFSVSISELNALGKPTFIYNETKHTLAFNVIAFLVFTLKAYLSSFSLMVGNRYSKSFLIDVFLCTTYVKVEALGL
jgi:hypothetical protein